MAAIAKCARLDGRLSHACASFLFSSFATSAWESVFSPVHEEAIGRNLLTFLALFE
jgi:hypothetical protein